MEFDNSFDVPLPPADAWAVLTDIPRIAPCMPGAQLTEVVDARSYKGKIAVRLGPVALTFAGRVTFESFDAAQFSARVKAQGDDAKGRGSANALASFHIEPAPGGSRVLIHTDLMLSGSVAQYGRGVGMIQTAAAQLVGQFASNLRTQLAEQARVTAAVAPSTATAAGTAAAPTAGASEAPKSPLPPAARPISGFSLILRVIWQRIVAMFRGDKS